MWYRGTSVAEERAASTFMLDGSLGALEMVMINSGLKSVAVFHSFPQCLESGRSVPKYSYQIT
jgi:hypothetical protein